MNLLTGPLIYGMLPPLLLLDACVTLYQAICFAVYRIAKARRTGHFVYDRRQLGYLNLIERFHCTYCSYANGLLAYATERDFCPIKHARKVSGLHAHHARFLAYGDAVDHPARLEAFRQSREAREAGAPDAPVSK